MCLPKRPTTKQHNNTTKEPYNTALTRKGRSSVDACPPPAERLLLSAESNPLLLVVPKNCQRCNRLKATSAKHGSKISIGENQRIACGLHRLQPVVSLRTTVYLQLRVHSLLHQRPREANRCTAPPTQHKIALYAAAADCLRADA